MAIDILFFFDLLIDSCSSYLWVGVVVGVRVDLDVGECISDTHILTLLFVGCYVRCLKNNGRPYYAE